MKRTPMPGNEQERIKSLHKHEILNTLPEEIYDDITRLAADICGTPIASLNLISEDKQFAKSSVGVDCNGQRETSFCAHTILNPEEVMVVPDSRYDHRFADNPFTTTDPPIIFYAGVPVRDANGLALGSLCVIDSRPRELSDVKMESLKALAKLVDTHFEIRRLKIGMKSIASEVETLDLYVQNLITGTQHDDKGTRDADFQFIKNSLTQIKSILS